MSTQKKVSCINVSKGVVHCLYERIQDSKIFMFHMLKKRKKKSLMFQHLSFDLYSQNFSLCSLWLYTELAFWSGVLFVPLYYYLTGFHPQILWSAAIPPWVCSRYSRCTGVTLPSNLVPERFCNVLLELQWSTRKVGGQEHASSTNAAYSKGSRLSALTFSNNSKSINNKKIAIFQPRCFHLVSVLQVC